MKSTSLPNTLIVVLLFSLGVSAQDRKETLARLKQAFEGKKAVVKIDMPATRDGIDIRPEKTVPFDTEKYSRRLGDFGTAIRAGSVVTITEIEVGGDQIEVHLDGGGYGNGADVGSEPPVPVRPQPLPKSEREIEVETMLRTETNRARIDFLRSELNRERNIREDEDRANMSGFERAVEDREYIIRNRRLKRGSRIHIRFDKLKTATVTEEMLTGYLKEYLDFAARTDPASASAVGPKPYARQWRNAGGETLSIDETRFKGAGASDDYEEIFRLVEARIYVLKLTASNDYVLVTMGDGEMRLRYYGTLTDLQNGTNAKGEEVWTR